MPRRTRHADLRPQLDADHLAAQADFLDRFARAGRLTGPSHAGDGLLAAARGAAREAIASGRPDERFRPSAPVDWSPR